jgi:hypothetical protein
MILMETKAVVLTPAAAESKTFSHEQELSPSLKIMFRTFLLLRFQIEPDYDSSHGFQLSDRRLSQSINDDITADRNTKEIRFSRFANIRRERQSLFWKLPAKFTGNQV